MERALQDLADFEQRLRALGAVEAGLADFFVGAEEVVVARAPGRLDVLGGIADYSGSLVLELPLADAACVAAARTQDAWVRVASLGRIQRHACFSAPQLWAACESDEALRAYLASQGASVSWTGYLLGGFRLLAERGVPRSGGLRLLLDSSVPEGKGVGSSAAVEVAALRALSELWQVPLGGRELALACQRVENHVVGAPCGVMDQMTSACGEAGRLLALLCQPAELRGFVAPPPGVELFGIDSGLRHAVVGADYRHVRVAAFMGLRVLAERLGAKVRANGPGRVVLEADPLGGYLAKLPPGELTSRLRDALPELQSGAEFLAKFGGISDEATKVEPTATYMVKAATLHPIYEHARVQEFARSLPAATSIAELTRLGELMFASHASYSACGLGSDGTDALVEAARAVGPDSGVFGAKISGGGSGGTVSVLARADALPRLEQLSRDYADRTGRTSRVLAGSSPGAALVPTRRLALPPLPSA
jgi:galactokinase